MKIGFNIFAKSVTTFLSESTNSASRNQFSIAGICLGPNPSYPPNQSSNDSKKEANHSSLNPNVEYRSIPDVFVAVPIFLPPPSYMSFLVAIIQPLVLMPKQLLQ